MISKWNSDQEQPVPTVVLDDFGDDEETDGALKSDLKSGYRSRSREVLGEVYEPNEEKYFFSTKSVPNAGKSKTTVTVSKKGETGYKVVVIDNDKHTIERLLCYCCKFILRDSVQTEDGWRLCLCCAERIAQ